MHQQPKSSTHHASPEPREVSVGGLCIVDGAAFLYALGHRGEAADDPGGHHQGEHQHVAARSEQQPRLTWYRRAERACGGSVMVVVLVSNTCYLIRLRTRKNSNIMPPWDAATHATHATL